MSIQEEAAQALAERDAVLADHSGLDLASLEALRLRCPDDDRMTSAYLDLSILWRKREVKVELEELVALAEFFDKASLPLAAAFPVFMTFLASEKVLTDPWRTVAVGCSYLVGALLWTLSRLLAFKYGRRAKCGAAELGKVD